MSDNFNSKDLIDKYSNMIYNIAKRYLVNEDDAQDIVQEVLTKYVHYIKNGKSFNDEEHKKCWIIRVTMNFCCNEVNSARKKKNVSLREDISVVNTTSFENALDEAICNLEDKYKSVFNLFYINDLKIKEIAKILNITESNVKTRLKRTREFLKDFLKRGEEI